MGENTLETYNRKLNRFGKYEPEREPEFKKEDNTEAKFETISEEKPVAKTRSSLGVISLTLGIISVISTVFYYICLPAGIIGLVTGVKAVRKTGSKGGKAGEILSIVGLAICIFLYVSTIFLVVLANSDF